MKKYVVVGTGSRGLQSYMMPLTDEVNDAADLVAVCDKNIKRAKAAVELCGKNVNIYTDFDEMLRIEKPQGVIVTTKDADHSDYIIKALKMGCDVISEKPLTTDSQKFNAIYDAYTQSGKSLVVTFNCRFMPYFVRIKEILNTGVIGDILSVHFEWALDTSHGADYFRRWHRERKNSGSLLVHKSTHHFDILNWLIDEDPVKVNAFGTKRFYGPTRENRSERCLTCPHKAKCEFYLDIEHDELLKKLYLDCEDVDGYYRDRCVFADEIDIEDSVAINIKYSKGTVVAYSLTAHSPYEGSKIVINGTKGRIEAENFNDLVAGGKKKMEIRVYNRLNEAQVYHLNEENMLTYNTPVLPRSKGGDVYGSHGGADIIMRDMLFRGYDEDKLHQMADIRAGAMSLAVGFAANISMAEDRAVYVNELYDSIKVE